MAPLGRRRPLVRAHRARLEFGAARHDERRDNGQERLLARLLDLAAPDLHRNRAEVKREWAEAVTRRWGYCGVIATEGDELLGYVTMAPAGLVPRLSALATTPVNPEPSTEASRSRCISPPERVPAGRSSDK